MPKIISLIVDYRQYYLQGIRITLELCFVSLALGSMLGSVISMMKLSKHKIIRFIASAYIELVRGTPMMVQIAIVYFGSYALTGINISAFLASVIAVSLNSAAYVAEIIRSGIQSVDKGQWEAAKSLGLTQSQTMRTIIFPQAIKNILPALGNEFVTLIKETSVASTIGLAELMQATNVVRSTSFDAFNPLLIVAFTYFCLTFSISKLVGLFEKKLSYTNKTELAN